MASDGAETSFAALDAEANRYAHLFRSLGVAKGDRVAFWIDNQPAFFAACWGAHNAGLRYVPISTRHTPADAAYMVVNSEARVTLCGSASQADALRTLISGDVAILDISTPQFAIRLRAHLSLPLAGETRGEPMYYSSGTTGRPKGIMPPLSDAAIDEPANVTRALLRLYQFDDRTVFLSTGPLYHAAPLRFCMAVQAAGGVTVVMEKFDAEAALRAMERHAVTHSQWVPTMFVRLLRLPDEVRSSTSLRAHKWAIHGAAPCPVTVKEAMLDWWGPIIHEYYGGSESVGMCAIGPVEWMAKKGSVGRASRGVAHVVGDNDEELLPGEVGLICFEGGPPVVYYKDEAKTAAASTQQGWGTFGDIGYMDEDGYVFLTDRRDHVIISGGVNIYPQEAENVLAGHESVLDVAVFGIPDPEYGETVKAVVELAPGFEPSTPLKDDLMAFCRSKLATIKCPRSIDFERDLPREPTGKLVKRIIKARYWPRRSAGEFQLLAKD